MAVSSEDSAKRHRLTHRDCPSKLPWNQSTEDDDLVLDNSDDEGHMKLKTVTMGREDLSADQHLQAQFLEGTKLWTDEDVIKMHEDVQEKGVEWWLKEYVVRREISPRKLLLAFGLIFSKEMEPNADKYLRILKMTLLRIVRRRERLKKYNTIEDVATLLRESKRILVLSGAGISVASGIPDFRSKQGIYQMLSMGEYELDDPQQMFDLQYFKENPQVFYSFAREIFPTNHEPSLSHRFIKLLEIERKLLRDYTQNIDDLESSVNLKRVLHCHGSFSNATCMQCGLCHSRGIFEKDILAQRVPVCMRCPPPKKPRKKKRKNPDRWNGGDKSDSEDDIPKAILKPNITFFGEKLTDKFDELLRADREVVDLLIVMGTSLEVTPVSEVLAHIPHSVPQILINKTPIKHMNADIVLLGNADTIVDYLCREVLAWELPIFSEKEVFEKPSSSKSAKRNIPTEPRRVGNSHVWLFEGAEGGRFVENLEAEAQGSMGKESSRVSADARPVKKARAR